MNIINARLRGKPGLFRVELNGERIAAIVPQTDVVASATANDLDAGQNLVVAPFVEPHIHLDATLTAGEPKWNMSGTLFEGIERWSERKEITTQDDIKTRAKNHRHAGGPRYPACAHPCRCDRPETHRAQGHGRGA